MLKTWFDSDEPEVLHVLWHCHAVIKLFFIEILDILIIFSYTTNVEVYMAFVTSYISKCTDDVTVSKTITTHSNQKPWMTVELRALLSTRDPPSGQMTRWP